MSFRKKFNQKAAAANKKMRIMAASAVLAFSAAGGGYIGHEITQAQNDAHLSGFTVAQVSDMPEGMMTEKLFTQGRKPDGAKPDLLQANRVDEFTARIDGLQQLSARLAESTSHNPDEAAVLDALLTDNAVSFINDLRMAHNLSEQNYRDLIADYQTRVGRDVSEHTGNYTDGIRFLQEAQLSTVFGAIFGDDLSDAEMSREVGDIMKNAVREQEETGMTAGAAGGLVTGLLLMPLMMFPRRRRDAHVKLPLEP